MEGLNSKVSCSENETKIECTTKTANNKEEDGNLDTVLPMAKSPETTPNLPLHGEKSLAVEEGFPTMEDMTSALELELESSTLLDLSQFHILPIEDRNLDSVLPMAKNPETKQNLPHHGESVEEGFPTTGEMTAALELEMKSSALLDLSQFHILPIELKHAVLKRFPIETKRAARLVSKEWEIILRDYVQFTPILTSETFVHVTSSEQKFHEMTVTGEMLDISLPKPIPTFVGGKNIRKLYFKEFTIDVNTIKWIFVACSNVEEIRANFSDMTHPFHHRNLDSESFSCSCSVLPTSFSLCQNLRKFEIYVARSDPFRYCFEFFLYLDCSPLQFCTNLKYFNIRSTIVVILRNCAKLPPSVKKLSLILLHSPIPFPYSIYVIGLSLASLSTQFSLQDFSKYSLSTEDWAELSKHFPNLYTIDFAPNLKSEWEVFRNIISDVKTELYSKPVEVSKILNFSKIF